MKKKCNAFFVTERIVRGLFFCVGVHLNVNVFDCSMSHLYIFLTQVEMDLCGSKITANISINNVNAARIHFVLKNNPYEFNITKWGGRGLSPFATKFHEFYELQTERLGLASTDEYFEQYGEMNKDGVPDLSDRTKNLNIITRAIADVFDGINRIYNEHGRGMLDYAVWHRENLPQEDDYGSQIMKISAHCIVHSDLMAPNVIWQRVLFT